MNLYIGKEMMLTPEVFIDKSGRMLNEKRYPCKVVSINEEHRHFTVRFTFPGGSFLETFKYTKRGDYPCPRRKK